MSSMTDPLALAVIDAARAYSDAWCRVLPVSVVDVLRHNLFDAVLRYVDATTTERHTLPDGTVVLVEGGGVGI